MDKLKVILFFVLIIGSTRINFEAFVYNNTDDSTWYYSEQYNGTVYAEVGDDVYVEQSVNGFDQYFVRYTGEQKVEAVATNFDDVTVKTWTFYKTGAPKDVSYYRTYRSTDGIDDSYKYKTIHYDSEGNKEWTQYYDQEKRKTIYYQFDIDRKYTKKVKNYYGTSGNLYKRNVWNEKHERVTKYLFVTSGQYKGQVKAKFTYTNKVISKIQHYYLETKTVHRRYLYDQEGTKLSVTYYSTNKTRQRFSLYRNGQLLLSKTYDDDGNYLYTKYH